VKRYGTISSNYTGAEKLGQMYEYRPSTRHTLLRAKEVDTSITDAAVPLNHGFQTTCEIHFNKYTELAEEIKQMWQIKRGTDCLNYGYNPSKSHPSTLFSMALPAHSGPRPLIHFRNHFSQTVGLLGRVISSSQGLFLNTGQHKHRINAYTHQTTMP
jgi:hypothetical protein